MGHGKYPEIRGRKWLDMGYLPLAIHCAFSYSDRECFAEACGQIIPSGEVHVIIQEVHGRYSKGGNLVDIVKRYHSKCLDLHREG